MTRDPRAPTPREQLAGLSLDFLSRATARTSDPDTSKQAGAQAASDHGRQAHLILVALVALIRPATGKEIAGWLDGRFGEAFDSVKVMRRIAKMRDDGLVSTYDGKRSGWPLTKRDGQCLHEATEAGRQSVRKAS